MTFPLSDFVNSIFEAGIGFLQWKNVALIRKDREVRGIHWGITAWTSLWGGYNLYYYPHLGQYLSFTGGLAIFSANLIWLAHAMYYTETIPWRPWGVPPKKDALPTTALMFDVIGR